MSEIVGFGFYINYGCIGGGATLSIDQDTYEKFKDRPLELVALRLGVTVNDYLRWYEAQGYVRCIATTGKHKQCKCFIPGVCLECREWVEANKVGGYCHIHGGGK